VGLKSAAGKGPARMHCSWDRRQGPIVVLAKGTTVGLQALVQVARKANANRCEIRSAPQTH